MKSIHYKGLYGRFNYDIDFCQDGLTILTGPNGFGKTTILRTIEAFSKGEEGIDFFKNLDFECIKVVLSENTSLTVQKKDGKLTFNNIPYLKDDFVSVTLKSFLKNISGVHLRNRQLLIDTKEANSIEEELEELNKGRMQLQLVDQVIEQKYQLLKSYAEQSKLDKHWDILKKLRNNVYFIHEQRLIKQNEDIHCFSEDEEQIETDDFEVVEELPDKFKDEIRSAVKLYTRRSRELDKSFPKRLFESSGDFNKDDYINRFNQIQSLTTRLNKYGLAFDFQDVKLDFKSEQSKALRVYCDDLESKYLVYIKLLQKLDLFSSIVDKRFKFKKCYINMRVGIVIKDGKNNIPLKLLSSGEKQILVLFYELIFNTNKNMILLIDEPELSLHIVWQEQFMDDLEKIIKLNNIKVIVATHSPQIINNRWANQIDLGGLYSAQLNSR